jgi:hypothetical protein
MVITRKKITGLLIIPVFIATTSCATQIREVWRDENFKGKFKRILVIGVTKNFKLRERFEYECKKNLEEAGIDAVASFDEFPDFESLTKENIKNEAIDLGADAVLISRLIDYKKREKVVAPEGFGGPYDDLPFTDYYYGAFNALHANEGSFTEFKNITMETRLFDVKSEKPVISAVSQTHTTEANIDFVTSFSKFLVHKLIEAKVLDIQ